MVRCLVLEKTGSHEGVKVIDQPSRSLGSDEVEVDVKVCGVNFFDIYSIQGLNLDAKLPYILGMECAGIVTKTGGNAKYVKLGDRVIVHKPYGGAFCEKILATEDCTMLMPDSMSFEDGASITVNYMTAYFALMHFKTLVENDSVFIHGAAGGVGWAATQIAKTIPGVIVFGTSSPFKFDAIRENGVDFPMSYDEDYKAEIDKYRSQGISLVIDCMAGKYFTKSQDLLGPFGAAVLIGAKGMISGSTRSLWSSITNWWTTKNVAPVSLIMNNRAVAGLHLNKLKEKDPETFRKGWNHVMQLYTEKKIKPHIDSVWKLEDYSQAFLTLEERRNIGKVLLIP